MSLSFLRCGQNSGAGLLTRAGRSQSCGAQNSKPRFAHLWSFVLDFEGGKIGVVHDWNEGEQQLALRIGREVVKGLDDLPV